MEHSLIRVELGLPSLTPDVIDDFVSWLHSEGIRTDEFRIVSMKQKRSLFSTFWEQYPPLDKNYKMEFPND